VLRQERLELASKVEIDPCQQDRRHPVRVTRSVDGRLDLPGGW
jgi:hypothetical protein